MKTTKIHKKDKTTNLELLGYLLILISGLTPFIHSFVKHKVLAEKLFGFISIHTFLYAIGVHLSILLITLGLLLLLTLADKLNVKNRILSNTKKCLISPFISAIFYLVWVFIPDVDYNFMAYVFTTLLISVVSVFIFKILMQKIKIQRTISKEIATDIISKLSNFEKSQHFLNSGITLSSLATELSTNNKYLSKTINSHKQKTFRQYINDLRIDYIVNTYSENNKFHNYTIAAIAKEIGFNTTEAFSKAFIKKTGEKPSDFIKMIASKSKIH